MDATSQTPDVQIKLNTRDTYRIYVVIGLLFLVFVIAAILYLSDRTLLADALVLESETTGEIAALTTTDISVMLLRNGIGPGETDLDVLYAPTWYFDWNNRALPITEQPILAFFLFETVHSGDVPLDAPQAYLRIDNREIVPIESHIVSDAPHHRISQVLFPLLDENGQRYVTDETEQLVLVTPIDGVVSGGNTFQWDLPLPYGLGAVNESAAEIGPGQTQSAFSWTALLAIMGGMLSALSPCLLQLGVYYAAVLAGTDAGLGEQKIKMATARLAIMRVSIFFVIGFTLVYTLGGIIAGYLGQSLEQLSGLQQWFRPVSFVVGIIIVIMALRVAIQARAPLICRLPIRVNNANGRFTSALMGVSFAIGCLSCFSATVLSGLLLYAGSTGSPISGGLLLFLFSAGVGVIFLLAAWAMTFAAPQITDSLQAARPYIGGISALVMLAFGILMMTYEFHTVSGFLFRLFSS